MFLRKFFVIAGPLLLCGLLLMLFNFMDTQMAFLGFFNNVVKGILVGVAVAFIIPLIGARRREPFAKLLWIPTVILFLLITYQFLHQAGTLRVDALSFLAVQTAQALFTESIMLGFCTTLAIRAS